MDYLNSGEITTPADSIEKRTTIVCFLLFKRFKMIIHPFQTQGTWTDFIIILKHKDFQFFYTVLHKK